MDENMKKDEELVDTVILTDEDGNEIEFEIIGQCEKNGQTYFAMIPADEDEQSDDVLEYIILKLAQDGDEEVLVTVDDDDESDDIADYFDDLFSRETDYDL